jgi:membrane protein DedA with SNARE-associated domain
MGDVYAWVAMHGYSALFFLLMLGIVGLPVPDETLLVFAGYLIWRGQLQPLTTYSAATAGTWCGITLSYTLGRTLGAGAVHRYGKYIHITDDRLAKVHRWFDRIGHWALFVGYFIAGVRHFTAIIAGMSKLELRSFTAYAWTGGALWTATFLTLGYYLGENWRVIADVVHRYIVYASVIVVAVAALIYWRRWRASRLRSRS